MATKVFCDDCNKEINIKEKIMIWHYYFDFDNFELCYTCFAKHWKPISKKFTIDPKNAERSKYFKT